MGQGCQGTWETTPRTYILQSRTLELSPYQTPFFPDCSDLLEVLIS